MAKDKILLLSLPDCYCSVAKSCQILCNPMVCSTPASPVLHCLLEFAQTHVHSVSDAVQPSHPLSPPSPTCPWSFPESGSFPTSQLFASGGQGIGPSASASVFPRIRVFSSESALCIRWPKYWSPSFSISPSNEYSGLISFRIDWFDLLVVQGTPKNLLQHHTSKASILWALSLLYGSTLTSIHDYWENHSFDYTNLC